MCPIIFKNTFTCYSTFNRIQKFQPSCIGVQKIMNGIMDHVMM